MPVGIDGTTRAAVERTIESQLFELRRQIARGRHVLVKE
jgi:uncharacterized protein YheU (UPF0270 family)